MSEITKEEKKEVFDDLIKYYRFCKTDRRNHIFNAIYALKTYRKRNASQHEITGVELLFKKAKKSYGYYGRMKSVALLLKLNLLKFTTSEERKQAIKDILFHYECRLKTKLHYVQVAEKRLAEKNLDEELSLNFKKRLEEDKKEYEIYSKKMEIAEYLKNEIEKLT